MSKRPVKIKRGNKEGSRFGLNAGLLACRGKKVRWRGGGKRGKGEEGAGNNPKREFPASEVEAVKKYVLPSNIKHKKGEDVLEERFRGPERKEVDLIHRFRGRISCRLGVELLKRRSHRRVQKKRQNRPWEIGRRGLGGKLGGEESFFKRQLDGGS